MADKPELVTTLADRSKFLGSRKRVTPLTIAESKKVNNIRKILLTIYSRGSIETGHIKSETGLSGGTVTSALKECLKLKLVLLSVGPHNSKNYEVNFDNAKAYLVEMDMRGGGRMRREISRATLRFNKALDKYVTPVKEELEQLGEQNASFKHEELWKAAKEAHVYKQAKKESRKIRKKLRRREERTLGTVRGGTGVEPSPEERAILKQYRGKPKGTTKE